MEFELYVVVHEDTSSSVTVPLGRIKVERCSTDRDDGPVTLRCQGAADRNRYPPD